MSTVYFTHDLSPAGLLKIYDRVSADITGKVAIKWHSGEPHGPNILPRDMVRALQQHIPDSNLVETNTLYEGGRDTTEKHRRTLAVNGWDFCPVDIMDEHGAVMLPVRNGRHFKEMSMGKGIMNYDSMVVLTHFKGHTMGGFGGSIKNIAIGNADAKVGKAMIHGSRPDDFWITCKEPFMEAMVESASATLDRFGSHIVYINVLRNMSVDCDCAGTAAEPARIRDIGIFASTDIVAVDQASVDAVYAMPASERHDLKERMESRAGLHQLPYAEQMGLGSRKYDMVRLDDTPSGYETAVQMVRCGEVSCAAVRENRLIAQRVGRGVKPLLELADDAAAPLKDATLVDKVIGRAAAFIAIQAGVRTVTAELMSEGAMQLLQSHHIPATAELLVPDIMNRSGSDICPLEKLVRECTEPQVAVERIRSFRP